MTGTTPTTGAETGRKSAALSLQWQMLAGFGIGLLSGLAVYMVAPDAPWVMGVTTYVTGPIGQIFLRAAGVAMPPAMPLRAAAS